MSRIFLGFLLFIISHLTYADCSFNMPPLNFGVYNPVASEDALSSTIITVNCTPSNNYTLKISQGNSGNYTDRQMTGPDDVLHYNLFTDAGRMSLFGDGSNNTTFYSGTGSSVGIYAKIGGRQTVKAGSYNDFLSIDLSF